ncbi:MAG: STAS domain-containing protein [Planctomycetaceae bacterium]|nr:STAS domain-containing protein [Planctomycetaceae bacterium]
MAFPTEIFGDIIVVHTPEELGADQGDALAAQIPSLDRRCIVLDMDTTETIDSKGLATLLDVQEKVRDAGGEIKITTTNASNRKILEITRFDQQIEVFDSMVDAVRSF